MIFNLKSVYFSDDFLSLVSHSANLLLGSSLSEARFNAVISTLFTAVVFWHVLNYLPDDFSFYSTGACHCKEVGKQPGFRRSLLVSVRSKSVHKTSSKSLTHFYLLTHELGKHSGFKCVRLYFF